MAEIINVFSDAEKKKARGAKKNLLFIWSATVVLYCVLIGVLIGVNLYLVEVYADRSTQVWMTVVSVIASCLFFCWTWFFFTLKFKMTTKYVRMLRDTEIGLKDDIEAKFVEYDNSVSMKDGVFFYSMVLDCKPLKREDITMRKLLIERTVNKPNLNPGDRLKIVSHANILVSYEIVERAPVIEKEEVNEKINDTVNEKTDDTVNDKKEV